MLFLRYSPSTADSLINPIVRVINWAGKVHKRDLQLLWDTYFQFPL